MSERKDLHESIETSNVWFEDGGLTKRQEAELEVAELKMLRFSLGLTRMDRIRNKHIRRTAQVRRFGGQIEMVWRSAEEEQ